MFRFLLDLFIVLSMAFLTGTILFFLADYMHWILGAICLYGISEVAAENR